MELKEVMDKVEKETKAIGDNVTALKTSVEKDIADIRKLAEQKGADPTELKKIQDIAEGVAAKHEALETKVSELTGKGMKAVMEQIDEVERKLNKVRLMGTSGLTDVGAEMKGFRMFHEAALAHRGELKIDTDTSDEQIPVDDIKSYGKKFGKYLRRGNENGTMNADEQKAMSVGSDPDGGYFVTPFMSPRILSIIYETSPVRQLATVETISTDAIEFPVDDNEASAGWVGEQESRTDSATPQVGVQRIPVHEMYSMPKATQKLLEDASVNIEAWLANKIGQKFGRLEATAFVTGDGIKKPRGFTTYANGTSRGQIEQIVSGNATSLTFDGLINLTVALKEPYAPGASFLMRRATVGVVMLMKDGEGQYIWRTDNQAGKPSVLLGHPVYQAADMAAVGASALAVAFGNFNQGYTIVDRLGISTLRDPFTAKPFVVFYTRKRVGGDVTTFEAIKLQVCSA